MKLVKLALCALLALSVPALANTPDAAGFAYRNITTATTTTVKTGQGVIHEICINTPAASGVVVVYDNTAGSGTKVGTITNPATLLGEGPVCAFHDIALTKGLTIVTTGSQDITVVYH